MAKREVTFNTPHIDQKVVGNPAAMAYAERLKNKYTSPVAGGPTPPIPNLSEPTQGGMTMADQARVSTVAPASSMPPSTIFQPEMHRTQPQPAILPGDLLPEAARQDPSFQAGMGSMFAASQPHLATKYGVLRNGQAIPAQQLSSGKPGLRRETIEGIKAVQQARVETQQEEATSTVPPADRKPEREDKEAVQKALEKMDDYDFNTFREMMMKDLLNNEDQKKAIESRLEPLDITDLILHGRICQKVPVVPGKFEPEFQSVTAEEDLAIKRLVWQEQKSLNAPNQYMLDKYSLMGVALSVRAINNVLFPEHTDQDGNFDDAKFITKYNRIVRLPFHMLSSLGINFFWFDIRVRKLFQADTIKNG